MHCDCVRLPGTFRCFGPPENSAQQCLFAGPDLQVLSVAIRYTAGFARSTYGDINSTFNGQFPPVPLVPADSAVGGIDKALPLFD